MKIALMLLTWGPTPERRSYARKTLRTALDLLWTDHHELYVHIADDGSPVGHVEELLALSNDYPDVKGRSSSNAARGGYGKNYNLGTQALHEAGMDAVLCLEDDWELMRELRLDPIMDAFATGKFGALRLGGFGFTKSFLGRFEHVADRAYFLFDPASEDPHVFSGNPRIETVEWQRAVGPWPEHMMDAGDVEFAVAHVPAARRGVAWDFEIVRPSGDLFAHIGSQSTREIEAPSDA